MTEQSLLEKGNVLTVYKTLFLDLPLAGIRQVVQATKGREATEAAWKNYDERVRLATLAINNLYRNPRFGETVDRALQEMLRWQRLSNAVSGAFFTRLWPTTDLPTAAEVRELLKELRVFADYRAQWQSSEALAGRLSNAPSEQLPAPVSRSSDQREHEHLLPDLLDYFEPVDWHAAAVSSEQRRLPSSSTDLSEYFEPVDYPAAPARNTKLQKHLSHVHQLKAETRAAKHPRLRRNTVVTTARATEADDNHAVSA